MRPRLNYAPNISSATAVPSTAGSPGWFYETYPDLLAFNGGTAINAASTTQIVTGTADQCLYVFFLGVQASATQAGASFYFAYGPNSSSLTKMLPSTQVLPVTAGNITSFYSGAQEQNANGGVAPAAYPFVVPPGNNLYVVCSGTTIHFYPLVYYAQV